MARWIYNRPPEKCQAAELAFARILNELPDDWIVRWEFFYEDDAGIRREGDFLILGPSGGLLVAEVKSTLRGNLRRGWWEESARDNPLFQLDAEHKAVLRSLQAVAGKGRVPFVDRALVTPALDVAEAIREVHGIPRQTIIARNDLERFPVVWSRIFHRKGLVHKPQREVFLEAYGEELDPKNVRAFVTETDRILLLQATAEFKVLDMLSENPRLVLEGGVGTGKTLHALEQAVRYAEASGADKGRSVLLLCYNLALAQRLRQLLERKKLKQGYVSVRTWEEICREILRKAKVDSEPPADRKQQQRYYDEELPGKVLEAVRDLPTLAAYDARVVDEAQDHDTSYAASVGVEEGCGWWDVYFSLLRGGDQAPLSVFLDPAQRPPFRAAGQFDLARLRKALGLHTHVRFGKPVRYTRQIFDYLKTLGGAGSQALVDSLREGRGLPEGEPVVLRASGPDLETTLSEILAEWQEDGLCNPSNVLLLYPRSTLARTGFGGLTQLAGHRLVEYRERERGPKRQHAIHHCSAHKAKGLDARAVILIGMRPFEEVETPSDRFTYFMGVSRARQLLAVVDCSSPM